MPEDRINARLAQINRENRAKNLVRERDLQPSEIQTFIDADVQLWKAPEPRVPYPHKSKEVTAAGFVRDQPTLAQKAVKRCERWHEERKKLTSIPSRGANDGDTTHMELSPTKFMDAIDWDREQTFDSSHNFRTPGIRKKSFAAGPSAYRSLAMIQESSSNSK